MAAQFSKIFGAEGETEGAERKTADEMVEQSGMQKDDAPTDAPTDMPSDPSQFETFLGAGCSVEGRLVCKGPARLSGAVKGEIAGDSLVSIDDGAVVTADVNVREANISGRVIGNVSASARVTLGATALIDGDIKTPSLSISEGAQIMGRIEVKPGAGETPRTKTAQTATSPATQTPASGAPAKPAGAASSQFPGPTPAAPLGDTQS